MEGLYSGEVSMTTFAPTTIPDYQFGKRFRCNSTAGAKDFVTSDEVKRRLGAGQKMITRLVRSGRNLCWIFEFVEPSKPRRVGNAPPVIAPKLTAKQKRMNPEDLTVERYLDDQIMSANIFLATEKQQTLDPADFKPPVGTEVNAE
jgi:hypothetical protein